MKMREIIQKVDRSVNNTDEAHMGDFMHVLNIGGYEWADEFGARVKKHALIEWICTDTWVGVHVYYMDDEPVAISVQTARKNDKEFEFVSQEAADKVRNFINEIVAKEESNHIDLIDLDKEFGEPFFTVNYGQQLLTRAGFYKGDQVTVVKTYEDIKNWSKVKIKFQNGSVKVIPLKEFNIPIKITE